MKSAFKINDTHRLNCIPKHQIVNSHTQFVRSNPKELKSRMVWKSEKACEIVTDKQISVKVDVLKAKALREMHIKNLHFHQAKFANQM